MSAVPIRPPSFDQPFVDETGRLTTWARLWLSSVYNREGGEADKVDAAYVAALAAVPQTTEIIPSAPLMGGGYLDRNVPLQFGAGVFSVASLPTPSLGLWAYAQDGRKTGEGAGAGTGLWVWSDGNAWYGVGSAVAAA